MGRGRVFSVGCERLRGGFLPSTLPTPPWVDGLGQEGKKKVAGGILRVIQGGITLMETHSPRSESVLKKSPTHR